MGIKIYLLKYCVLLANIDGRNLNSKQLLTDSMIRDFLTTNVTLAQIIRLMILTSMPALLRSFKDARNCSTRIAERF